LVALSVGVLDERVGAVVSAVTVIKTRGLLNPSTVSNSVEKVIPVLFPTAVAVNVTLSPRLN